MTSHGYSLEKHHKIIIRKGAYVGMRVTIVPKEEVTEIGENAVIGAGSLVLSSIPKGTTYAGHPARFIKYNKQ